MNTGNRPGELPANPLKRISLNEDYHRRVITGILESYNSNYDVLAETIQNAVDALEDAYITGLEPPFLLRVHVNLAENWLSVTDTGVGLDPDRAVDAFAPNVSFKTDESIVKARGSRMRYRGYKGVGLTFLAYGTDDITLHSKTQGGTLTKVRMQYARSWAAGTRREDALVVEDDRKSPLEGASRGTHVQLRLSQNTRPRSLAHIAASPSVWATILRTRTAVGQILLGDEPAFDLQVQLVVTDSRDERHEFNVDAEFLWPHTVEREPEYRFLNVVEYWDRYGESTEIRSSARRQDGIYLSWETDAIRKELTEDEREEFADQLAEYSPVLYAFLPYQSSVWGEMNQALTGVRNRTHLQAGLTLGINRQRMADVFDIPATRFEQSARRFFVLVHLMDARPDQGRKSVQTEVLDLAGRAADRALQYLSRQRNFLKPAGESPSPGQRQVEKTHDDWEYNVRQHADKAPLHLPPVTYRSEPLTEQDVVGLFNQLCALQVFAGLRVFATSQSRTYDCLVQYDCVSDTDGLRYRSNESSPLGVSPFVLGDAQAFTTGVLTLEFKNNLDGLVDDISGESAKDFPHIDICVCWGMIAERFNGFSVEKITPSNVDERRYPGTTHLLTRDGDTHVIQVIMLRDVVGMISGGRVDLPAIEMVRT